ncbi:uncharacterized protein B0T23DRAFT_177591 [Neurospora hispaniola]|uniref:Secreted protein n=1 Tax=Neurospora hispaniola TaxID=588809 RepID=A0AAJ0MQS0_9PEZI|nr:hypothetical protein B0T23DRAFT_177591 [Neurospora hispaniola]
MIQTLLLTTLFLACWIPCRSINCLSIASIAPCSNRASVCSSPWRHSSPLRTPDELGLEGHKLSCGEKGFETRSSVRTQVVYGTMLPAHAGRRHPPRLARPGHRSQRIPRCHARFRVHHLACSRLLLGMYLALLLGGTQQLVKLFLVWSWSCWLAAAGVAERRESASDFDLIRSSDHLIKTANAHEPDLWSI